MLTPSLRVCSNDCLDTYFSDSLTGSCLTEQECTSKSRQVSRQTKECVTGCNASLFLEPLTSTCLTADQCLSMCYLKKYDSPNLCLQTCSFPDLVDLDSFTCRSQSDCIKAGRVCDLITVGCLSECPQECSFSTDGVCGRGCPSERYLEESNSTCVLTCIQTYIEKTRTCIRYLDYEIVSAS